MLTSKGMKKLTDWPKKLHLRQNKVIGVMTSESQIVTIADIKQAAIKLGLWQWQRQWESSETGRSLFKYKPRVSDKSKIDIPDAKSYRNIAKLRLGYNKLKDYQHKIGNTDSNL